MHFKGISKNIDLLLFKIHIMQILWKFLEILLSEFSKKIKFFPYAYDL